MASTLGIKLNVGQNAAFPGSPSVECECGRVTVVLGANGTGKSRILKKLIDSTDILGAARKCVYVEGGRVVSPLAGKPPLNARVGRVGKRPPGEKRPWTIEEHYETSLTHTLHSRLQLVFELLVAQADPHKRRTFDALRAWKKSGRQGEQPELGDTLLDKVFDRFHQVFPDISLACDPESFEVSCRKGNETYPVGGLSDGEKQVLAMLADLASCAPPDAVFVVDEPELNLHPLLACHVWDVVEGDRPDALFIYGTHCISFAMRRSVDTRILLGRRGESAQPLPDVGGLDRQEAEEFLGAIPAIAVANKVVAVEGKEESFDTGFYQWLLGDDYKVVPVGSCDSVVAAAKGVGLWEKIAATVRIGGVVDRDYRAETEIGSLRGDSLVVVLDFHEAESYLCDPAFLVDFAHELHASTVSRTAIEAAIIKFAEQCANRTAFERTTRGAFFRFQLSSGPNDWVSRVSLEEIRRRLKALVEGEVLRLGNMNAESVDKMFVDEYRRIEKLISGNDVEGLLAIVPGKELLWGLVHLVGLQDMTGFLNAVSHHMAPDNYPRLKNLRANLLSVFHRDDTRCQSQVPESTP